MKHLCGFFLTQKNHYLAAVFIPTRPSAISSIPDVMHSL